MLSLEVFLANAVNEIVDQYVLKLYNFEKKTFWVFQQAFLTEINHFIRN